MQHVQQQVCCCVEAGLGSVCTVQWLVVVVVVDVSGCIEQKCQCSVL